MTATIDPGPVPELDDDWDEQDECPNCGGEGVIYMCVSDYACIDPDEGCDLCERRCDWCRPLKRPRPQVEGGAR